VLSVNRSVAKLQAVATAVKLNAPMLISVSHSCVEISYEPPANYSDKVMKYMTKYREDGQTDWKSMSETSNLTESISSLDEDSVYEIAVAARYQGSPWGPLSNALRVETDRFTGGKCRFLSNSPPMYM